MAITSLPKTRLGKTSAMLLGLSILSLTLMQALATLGERGGGGDTPINLKLLIPGTTTALTGILSFATGITAITWKKERAILVFISTFIGMLVLWFMIGEITVPH